ncbi:hypothetical protein SEVIR_8G027600v4 [Setaria viridis]|uniref:Acidic protein n=1 Tax=Setaria viridis TaxID=4556 RepID=A0A4U6TB71_SETVI|nr:hypothetical protein SEVIR_8G027600v2 [Setaria viridis]
MEGKGTTALMVIMCLVILSLNVNPATAAQCGCCESQQAKKCCSACTAVGVFDAVCEITCCGRGCGPFDPVAARMEEGQP